MATNIKKENDQQKRKAVMIDPSAHAGLLRVCNNEGLIMGRVVDKLIVDYVKRVESRGVDAHD
jgi:hypothetical protein